MGRWEGGEGDKEVGSEGGWGWRHMRNSGARYMLV